jgi:hypothetical protein|tara:strand:- start:42 stop:1028 length:987 start_codon:yes stop_codon:yes gene_type:complete
MNNGTATHPSVMIASYGKPKKRKTSDMLAAFPKALFLGVPSAITLVAQNELGFTPAVHPNPPKTLPELVQLLEQLAASNVAAQYGAVVIDDASHICKNSMLVWESEAPVGRSGKKDRFWTYQQLNRYLLEMSGLARHLGVHLAMTFHERQPGSNADGRFSPGGPDVPSRNQTETIPSWCDINVRAMVDPSYPDPWFPSVYYCDPTDSDWVTGDRTGVCTKRTPGNIREILRASESDYRLDRIDGLEWQDDIAEAVAEDVAANVDPRIVVQDVASKVQKNPLHLRWACQDGIARGVLRLTKQRGLFDFTVDQVEDRKSSGVLPPPPPTI